MITQNQRHLEEGKDDFVYSCRKFRKRMKICQKGSVSTTDRYFCLPRYIRWNAKLKASDCWGRLAWKSRWTMDRLLQWTVHTVCESASRRNCRKSLELRGKAIWQGNSPSDVRQTRVTICMPLLYIYSEALGRYHWLRSLMTSENHLLWRWRER